MVNGKPFCAGSSACLDCERDADCDAAFATTGAKWITRCPARGAAGIRSFCGFPPVEETVAAPALRGVRGSPR